MSFDSLFKNPENSTAPVFTSLFGQQQTPNFSLFSNPEAKSTNLFSNPGPVAASNLFSNITSGTSTGTGLFSGLASSTGGSTSIFNFAAAGAPPGGHDSDE
jgi:hypothetical protein